MNHTTAFALLVIATLILIAAGVIMFALGNVLFKTALCYGVIAGVCATGYRVFNDHAFQRR